MEFLKIKRFRKSHKPMSEEDPVMESARLPSEEARNESTHHVPKAAADVTAEENNDDDDDDDDDDNDDDDFITNEVKRRLKELRKNSFMVLIPEETCPEEDGEEEEETSSSEWRETEVADGYPWCGFDMLYIKYCERMLFFDKMRAQYLKETGSWNISNKSPRSTTKKLASTLRNLSFKRRDEPKDEREQLHQAQENDPCQNFEIAYVAQVCLAWEALHCQYAQLSQKISFQPENPTSYCYAAQAFQQFQVLLQRFIENEPFEEGCRVEIFVRARSSFPMLLQVPSFQGSNKNYEHKEEDVDSPVLASDLLSVIEVSILTFRLFLKTDKKKSGSGLNLFKGHHHDASSLHQVQASLNKKEVKVKELSKKKSWKKKSWPSTPSEVELLLGLIDIKVVSRVLRMERISKEQLLWCEEKMSKIDLSENKLRRDGAPIFFPC